MIGAALWRILSSALAFCTVLLGLQSLDPRQDQLRVHIRV